MNYKEAKELVEKEIEKSITPSDPIEPVVIDSETIEKEWGWVFFYQDKQYLDTGDTSFALVGNAPYLVNRLSGEITITGTANPIEEYIREYEEKLIENQTT